MPRKVRVTRHGLTECPHCQRHIRVAEVLTDTECPFCHIALQVSPTGAARAFAEAGRSALVAGALAGLATMGAMGCGDEEEDPAPQTEDAGTDDTTPDMTPDLVQEDIDEEPEPQVDYGGAFNNGGNNNSDAGTEN